MNLSKTFARIQLGAYITPPANSGDIRGESFIGRDLKIAMPDATSIWAARIYFGDEDEPVEIGFVMGAITPSNAGTRQVESATVTAAGGCTSAGTMTLTVTAAGVTGSPLAIAVPLTPAAHPSAAAIAAAAAAALNANTALAVRWTFQSSGATIFAYQIYPSGNDATMNIAIPAGLGVTAATTSTNLVAGVLGCVIERIGGDGNDIYGETLPVIAGQLAYMIVNGSPGSVITSTLRGGLVANAQTLYLTDTPSALADDFISAAGLGWADIIVING
jgi:hypothetical protein